MRFRVLELPFAAITLLWNSMMSWAGGWFFLMASEIFTVGPRDFRLPGIGAYLQTAASAGDLHAVFLGVLTLVVTIVALDQLLWRPVLAWADRFKLEMVAGDEPASSWFLDLLSRSWLVGRCGLVWERWMERLDSRIHRLAADGEAPAELAAGRRVPILTVLLLALLGVGVVL